ncbi:ABC transporter permease [Streptococcus saliviloxodontae]|uniref:ABC-2 type transport system permease protein n=1 Tax=Streptococcus saliviloxodontae TaxID=1349416 RepID=A0ABS2PM19_9STRE|nr:ABC transporter permease [Streptococcus saliviloxodontae]MBM7636485.1 ABC-2 type transport system permease protein [Streptococcus saliviloxodontae]
MIKELLARRRWQFHQQCMGYLRYVLNDHFVLVLVFLLGFILYQYSQLLKHFPSQPILLLVIVSLLLLVTSFMGAVACYLEEADAHFLLPKEYDVRVGLQASFKRSFFFWSCLQLVVVVLVAPIYLAAKLPLVSLFGIYLLLLAIRIYRLRSLYKRLLPKERLDWQTVIRYEKARKQKVLTFFALFTKVKGLSTTMKPRPYLNVFLRALKLEHGRTWLHLYSRAFLRNGDYFSLSLRLFGLGLVSMLLIKPVFIASVIAGLFNYLLLFQLIGLFTVYDYQLMTQLYPVAATVKITNFKQLMRSLFYSVTLLEVICGLFHWSSLVLLIWSVVLIELYLPRKLNKLID